MRAFDTVDSENDNIALRNGVLLKNFELELLFSFFSCHIGSACTVDYGWQNARVCGQIIVSFYFGSRDLKQVGVSVLLFLA